LATSDREDGRRKQKAIEGMVEHQFRQAPGTSSSRRTPASGRLGASIARRRNAYFAGMTNDALTGFCDIESAEVRRTPGCFCSTANPAACQ